MLRDKYCQFLLSEFIHGASVENIIISSFILESVERREMSLMTIYFIWLGSVLPQTYKDKI